MSDNKNKRPGTPKPGSGKRSTTATDTFKSNDSKNPPNSIVLSKPAPKPKGK